jgi:hypothetical protein
MSETWSADEWARKLPRYQVAQKGHAEGAEEPVAIAVTAALTVVVRPSTSAVR